MATFEFRLPEDFTPYRFSLNAKGAPIVQMETHDALGELAWRSSPMSIRACGQRKDMLAALVKSVHGGQKPTQAFAYVVTNGDNRLVYVWSPHTQDWVSRVEEAVDGVWEPRPSASSSDLLAYGVLVPSSVRVVPRRDLEVWRDRSGHALWS